MLSVVAGPDQTGSPSCLCNRHILKPNSLSNLEMTARADARVRAFVIFDLRNSIKQKHLMQQIQEKLLA
jgi:hypothetical protein